MILMPGARFLLLALMVILTGCGSSGEEQGGLHFDADLKVANSAPVQIQGVLKVTNQGHESVLLTSARCPLMLRAYRNDELVWDQGESAICPVLVMPNPIIYLPLEVRPGGELELSTTSVSAGEILGNQLDEGEYSLSIYVHAPRFSEPSEFLAGKVKLTR